MLIDAIILAGGAGTSLWPQSREKGPKLLLKIDGKETLLFKTIMRTLLLSPQRVVIITSKENEKEVNSEINKAKCTKEYLNLVEKQDIVFVVVKEPAGRNTAPAIALGSYVLGHPNNHNIAVMFPSDHVISNGGLFMQAIKSAYTIAKKGYIVTLGIAPRNPSTAYGYIETANRKNKKWYTVKSFKKKPDLQTAKKYYKSENYYYNSGILVFNPSDMIEAFDKQMPELSARMKRVSTLKVSDKSFDKAVDDIYNEIDSESIEYGILAKTKNVAVVPASFTWSDLGSWTSLYDVLDKDADDNVISGDVININSKRNFIRADKKLITIVGAEDLIVVDTDDVLLICDKESAEEVKALTGILGSKGYEKLV